ncbi:MAG: S-layer homology domain-containing protein [Clostridia bacterium]|nr:S-layer homology domain-containing protein [Clostridia bacterium]
MKKIIFLLLSVLLLSSNNIYAQSNTISVSEKYYAIKNDDSLWVWDKDENGEVQNLHKLLDNIQSVQMDYVIGKDGTVWKCKNDSDEAPVKIIENTDSVSVGSTAITFKKNDNSLWGIGSNVMGEMATGEEIERYDNPVKIMYNVQDAANGYSHTVILKTDGSVWTAGTNEYGVLGVEKDIEYSLKPLRIMDGISKIYTGETSTFAIDENGTLYRWGCNYGNGVGIDKKSMLYAPVKYTDNVKSVCSHWGFNLVLKQDGTLWIYGDSEDSNEGYTLTNIDGVSLHNLPKKIFDNVNSISEWKYSDSHSTLILTNEGELFEFDVTDGDKDHLAEIKANKIMDDVKISVESPVKVKKDFTDISGKSENVQESINSLTKANIISGTSETEFSPDKPITRAEIAALLLRMTAKNNEYTSSSFTDVTADDWYYNTAGASKKYNIVAGFEDNTFRGDETISKVQLISLAARTLRNEGNVTEETEEIKNSELPYWATDDISLALKEKLISETDLINIDDDMTRADAAVVLYRLYGKI